MKRFCVGLWVVACLTGGSIFVAIFGSCSSSPIPQPTPQAVSAGCHTDNDCKGDRICTTGTCVSPAPKADTLQNPDQDVPVPKPTDEPAQDEALKAAKARAKELNDESKSAYKKDKTNGTVADKVTGWVWADADNGAKISWQEAGAWCSKKGRGWRLPSSDELKTLYKNGDSEHAPKDELGGSTIKHPKEINVTGYFLWSNQATLLKNNGAVLDLHDGTVGFKTQKEAYALCILP